MGPIYDMKEFTGRLGLLVMHQQQAEEAKRAFFQSLLKYSETVNRRRWKQSERVAKVWRVVQRNRARYL